MIRFAIVIGLVWLLHVPALAGAGDKLTLRDCIDAAVRNHPSIRAAEGAMNAAQGRVGQARSRYFPQLQAATGYSESHSTNALGENTTKSATTSLSLSQSVYDFGRTGNALDAARSGMQAAEWDFERVRQNVVLNVKETYYALLQAERLVTVAEQTLQQANRHLAQAQAFFRAGAKPRFDVTRAEVEVNNARLGVINAKNSVRVRMISLNNSMGAPPRAPVAIEDVLSVPAAVPGLEEAQAEALARRPEMLKARADVDAARAQVGAERSGYLPFITASGAYNWNSGTSEAGAFFPKADIGNSWNAGITLTLPLFEGGLTRARVSEARANLLAFDAQQDLLRQSVLLDVNQAYAEIENATARIEVMDATLKKARENLDIAQGRYEAGVGAYIEVTDAQLASINAETDQVQALHDYQLAVARLRRAMGRME
ncbi:MAG: hypothetical protein A2072_06460 [Nitrospirae bacterium GWC1_57_7]|nr:MAG: hypothetical protein A2072_06460 [Nitrospirae bacterium GWC1_57_7]